ncbi:MAG: Crp/Fnr family transcriptional regulator [Anaerolineales bacterium]|jgi:CRP-like cAMP-binding protein|nr:Crp/Fnr family transcriptional regulator [Anaerolineales bacterium]
MSKEPAILLDEIGKIPLFQGVAQNQLEELLKAAHQKQIQAGEFFFLQDDPAERMYVLLEGRVKLSQAGPEGEQVLIRVITPVSLFALVAITTASSYLVAAQAAEHSLALYWTRQELMEFVLRTPQVAQNAMRIMAERLQEIQERFRQVTTERVERRLVHTLFRLAAQAGKQVDEGVLIDLTLTRQDLAEMSGTTLYTASRILSSWEKQGWVLASRERVIICNPHGLARILGNETG